MKKTVCIYKTSGETPLQAISRFKIAFSEYAEQKISFAGRLDPMAEGLLLLLIGNENKNRGHYENLNKQYAFQVLFGVKSDTYDILGLPSLVGSSVLSDENFTRLHIFCEQKKGKQTQTYPPYSSKPLDGKPLYYWARKNLLENKKLPVKNIFISSFHHDKTETITGNELLLNIEERIHRVDGNFRQKDILASWKSILNYKKNNAFSILRFHITCSSGTYVRSIANEIGMYLQTGALAYTITRTHVGDYSLTDVVRI